MILYTVNREQIVAADKPFAKGGEGAIHNILQPVLLKNFCIKIYYIQNQTKEKRSKIEFMVANQPKQDKGSKFLLCWPIETVQNKNGTFIGYIMPLAFNGSIQLYELVTTKIKKSLSGVWAAKFDRQNSSGLENRLKLSVNLSIAIHTLQQTSKYVLVDFKPQNTLVTSDGRVSITDLDSIQIANNRVVIHPAKVATPEYTPKEGERLNPASNYISETWDRFSLAVTLYELLFGIHPYAATPNGQYANVSTIDEKIKNNLFVHGSKRHYLNVIPSIHNNYNNLPSTLKQMFMLAFEEGSQMPTKRPAAAEWGEVIYGELQKKNLGSFTEIHKAVPLSLNPVKTKVVPPTVNTPRPVPVRITTNTVTSPTTNDSSFWLWLIALLIFVFVIFKIIDRSNLTTVEDVTTEDQTITTLTDSSTTMMSESDTVLGRDSSSKLVEKQKIIQDSPDSLLHYTYLISTDSTNDNYINHRGDLHYDRKEYKDAFEDYYHAHKIKDNEPIYMANVGFASAALNQHTIAINWYKGALEIREDADWLYMQAVSKIEVGDNKSAIDDLDRAIEITPTKFAMHYYYRGLAKLNSGDKSEACSDWAISLELGDQDAKEMINKYCR